MIRFVLIFIFCLLTGSYSYSQSGYPKLILWEGDSVAILSIGQMRALNLAKLSFDECGEMNSSLLQLDSLSRAELAIKEQLIENKDQQLLVAERRLNGAEATISTLVSQIQWKTTWQRLQGGVLLGAIAGLITYILIK